MGKKSGASSKTRSKGASAVESPPRSEVYSTASSDTAADAPGELSLMEVIADLNEIRVALKEGAWTERDDLLALDIRRKTCGDLSKAIGVRDELNRLRDLAAQLESDRQERAAMESGVQFTREAPQLPHQGSGDPH